MDQSRNDVLKRSVSKRVLTQEILSPNYKPFEIFFNYRRKSPYVSQRSRVVSDRKSSRSKRSGSDMLSRASSFRNLLEGRPTSLLSQRFTSLVDPRDDVGGGLKSRNVKTQNVCPEGAPCPNYFTAQQTASADRLVHTEPSELNSLSHRHTFGIESR